MTLSHRFDLFPRRPWRRNRDAFYTKLRRKVRWTGVATGVAVALIMVGSGWLIDGHDSPRSKVIRAPHPVAREPRSPATASRTPTSVAAGEFPLVPLRPAASLKVPPPPVVRSSTMAQVRVPPAVIPPAPGPASPRRNEHGAQYIVQLGTYRLEANARQDQDRYRGLGIDSQLSQIGAYVVLRLPPFATLDDAHQAEQAVRARGIKPLVIGPLR